MRTAAVGQLLGLDGIPTNMDDMSHGPNSMGSVGDILTSEQHAQLCQMIATLERNLAILEEFDLTLATALLDHVIAEVKRQFTNEH